MQKTFRGAHYRSASPRHCGSDSTKSPRSWKHNKAQIGCLLVQSNRSLEEKVETFTTDHFDRKSVASFDVGFSFSRTVRPAHVTAQHEAGIYKWSDGRKFDGQWARNRPWAASSSAMLKAATCFKLMRSCASISCCCISKHQAFPPRVARMHGFGQFSWVVCT